MYFLSPIGYISGAQWPRVASDCHVGSSRKDGDMLSPALRLSISSVLLFLHQIV